MDGPAAQAPKEGGVKCRVLCRFCQIELLMEELEDHAHRSEHWTIRVEDLSALESATLLDLLLTEDPEDAV